MTTPQEPAEGRIVPFRPRPVPTTSSAGSKGAASIPQPEPAHDADRLLQVSQRDDLASGPDTGVRQIRAVHLGASSGAFYPHTPSEHVPALAARLGIRTIELMLQTPGEYAPAFIAEVAASARAAGVTVGSVHTLTQSHPLLSVYPRRAEEGMTLFRQGIEAAATLGARVLVWHGPDRRLVSDEAGWERFIALSGELARHCAEAGITLGLENVSHGPIAEVRNVVRFATRLEEIGSAESIGFVFDPFQAAEAGANPFMMLAAMGNRVANVHISDYREHDRAQRHLLPGRGDLPWSALIRAIAGSGYSGPMMIEGPLGTTDEGISEVRAALEPLIRSVFDVDPGPARTSGGVDVATAMSVPPAGVLRGIALFNQREFYAQHEEIEAEWHAERGPIRRLYQGILQIGVGFHHALNGNVQGAIALLGDGIEKTSAFQPQALGIDTARLVTESTRCLDTIRALGPAGIARFDRRTIPTIHILES